MFIAKYADIPPFDSVDQVFRVNQLLGGNVWTALVCDHRCCTNKIFGDEERRAMSERAATYFASALLVPCFVLMIMQLTVFVFSQIS